MTSRSPECRFCEIALSDDASFTVLEDSEYLAFLDHRPVFPGHCLVIPKNHVETLAELADESVAGLFGVVKRIARAVETALAADGTFVAVNNRVSQSVPHLHVHVLPRRFKDGLKGFFWPRHAYASEDEKKQIQEKIQGALLRVEGAGP